MDSIEINKIAAAALCAALALGGSVLAATLLVPDGRPARPAFAIAGLEPDTAAPAGPPIAARLAQASAAHGAELAGSLCSACHGFNQGGAAQVGPNLFGVANRAVAAAAEYQYSDALKRAGGRWTPARLDAWLLRPQGFAPGTKMGFAGIGDASPRADVVAYLVSLSDTASAAPSAGSGFASLVASADPKAGAATASAQCSACHSFDKDGGAGIGPALHGVFGRAIGQGADYSYSAALSGHGGNWSVAALDDWLRNPRHFAPGTKMGFAGISDDKTRASVVAYLRSLPDAP